MPSEDTTQRLFDKLERLQGEMHDVKVDVAVIREKQERYYNQNEMEHNQLTASFAELKEDIGSLKEGHNAQQSTLDKRTGMHSAVKWLIGIGITFTAGGLGWLLHSLFGG